MPSLLSRLDGILLAVRERAPVADAYQRLLGAPVLREDESRAFAARRTVLGLGRSRVELLEPDGEGPVARFLERRRAGLFAAAFASPEPDALRARLEARGRELGEEGGRLLLEPEAVGVPGLRAVVGPEEAREPAGLVDALYEVTSLVEDWRAGRDALVDTFGLDPERFSPIRSEAFGYEGTLTLFREGELDRVEIITPTDPQKTLGRFFGKLGPCFYMAYAETGRTGAVRERLLEHAPEDWTRDSSEDRRREKAGEPKSDAPENLWIHPKALGGMMLGVSRTGYAWTWSGRPEWARAGAAR